MGVWVPSGVHWTGRDTQMSASCHTQVRKQTYNPCASVTMSRNAGSQDFPGRSCFRAAAARGRTAHVMHRCFGCRRLHWTLLECIAAYHPDARLAWHLRLCVPDRLPCHLCARVSCQYLQPSTHQPSTVPSGMRCSQHQWQVRQDATSHHTRRSTR